jgi:hypothetical protein
VYNPKKRVTKKIRFILSFLFDLPAVKQIKSGNQYSNRISSSTTFTLTAIIPNTESNKATVTYRKRVIKSIIRFQSLKENGTTKAIRNKT